MSSSFINLFERIRIISWGELNKPVNLIKNIVEGQPEEWRSSFDFFERILYEESDQSSLPNTYNLLLNNEITIVNPLEYFSKCVDIFENISYVSFIYTDYIDRTGPKFLPSFKPYIGKEILLKNPPVIYRGKPPQITKYKNFLKSFFTEIANTKIGHHLAESHFQINE
jgi:hypothetical protein